MFRKAGIILLVAYLIAASGAAGYYILIEMPRIHELESDKDTLIAANDELEDEIEDLKDEKEDLADELAEAATLLSFTSGIEGGSVSTEDIMEQLSGNEGQARDSNRKADFAEFRTALELYYDDNLAYPEADAYADLEGLLTPMYIKKLPVDPLTGEEYAINSTAESFTITAVLESTGEEYSVENMN
ncbi:MAG TPA: hypothetical protein PKL83_05925 [bacterium]|nr:hypothetical protein [bacterium]